MQRILSIDDGQVTHKNIRDMLILVRAPSIRNSTNRLAIKNFAFKYLSDNHKLFELNLYKECWNLLRTIHDSDQPFDETGLYLPSIYEELREYSLAHSLFWYINVKQKSLRHPQYKYSDWQSTSEATNLWVKSDHRRGQHRHKGEGVPKTTT
jgi:hypothetical protein